MKRSFRQAGLAELFNASAKKKRTAEQDDSVAIKDEENRQDPMVRVATLPDDPELAAILEKCGCFCFSSRYQRDFS